MQHKPIYNRAADGGRMRARGPGVASHAFMKRCRCQVTSPSPIPSVESVGRRKIGRYLPGTPDALGAQRLKAVIRSIGPSLNRRLSVVWSTGFTRTVSIFGTVAVVASVAPVVAGPCACAASDHAAAAPPNRLMNSRLMVSSIRDVAASRSRRGGAIGRARLGPVIWWFLEATSCGCFAGSGSPSSRPDQRV